MYTLRQIVAMAKRRSTQGAQGFWSDVEWLGWQDTKTTALLLHTIEGSVRQLSVTHLEDEK
jgi:hypothetical protein